MHSFLSTFIQLLTFMNYREKNTGKENQREREREREEKEMYRRQEKWEYVTRCPLSLSSFSVPRIHFFLLLFSLSLFFLSVSLSIRSFFLTFARERNEGCGLLKYAPRFSPSFSIIIGSDTFVSNLKETASWYFLLSFSPCLDTFLFSMKNLDGHDDDIRVRTGVWEKEEGKNSQGSEKGRKKDRPSIHFSRQKLPLFPKPNHQTPMVFLNRLLFLTLSLSLYRSF